MNPHRGTIKINPWIKPDEQRNAHLDSQTLSTHRNTSSQLCFHLGIMPRPALQDSVTKSPIKHFHVVTTTVSWGYCSLCHSALFMRPQRGSFSLDSVPGIIVLLLGNRWASFLLALGNMFPLMSKLKSQMCGLPQASLDAFMALLNSSHVSFFCFPSPPLPFIFLLQFI